MRASVSEALAKQPRKKPEVLHHFSCPHILLHFIHILFSPCHLTLSQISLFLRVCSTSILKTRWEEEKLLVMSNFSFSNSVFYPRAVYHLHEIKNCLLQTLSGCKSLKFVFWERANSHTFHLNINMEGCESNTHILLFHHCQDLFPPDGSQI